MARSLAVITGASSGIGRVFALRLARDHDLLLVARREARLQELARELRSRHGGAVEILAADLTDAAQIHRVAERISAAQNLTLLVNNAGFGLRRAFWKTDLELLERMHRLHVMAVLRLTHAALRVLVEHDRGAVINVASVAAFAQRAGSAGYGATKSWLASLTEGIHLDLRRAGSAVAVQALCPGFTYSEFHDVTGDDRNRLAPPSLWLTADQVVDASLAGLERRAFRVVPGWRYRLLLAVLTRCPTWLKLRLEATRA